MEELTPHGKMASRGREDSRDRIIDAALRLFAEKGFGATSTKSIAEEAGVATGLVFYYFSSKQELLESLLAERSFAPRLEQILSGASAEDPSTTLRTIGRQFEALLVEHHDLIRVLLTAAGPGNPAHDGFQALLRRAFTDLSDYLLTAFGTDQLKPSRARAIGRAFMASIFYNTVLLPLNGSQATYIDETIEMLLSGLSPREDDERTELASQVPEQAEEHPADPTAGP